MALVNVVEEFYLCMGCGRKYDENPVSCSFKTKEVHARFSEKYDCTYTERGRTLAGKPVRERMSSIQNWIFKWQLGQVDSLDDIPALAGGTAEPAFDRAGFKVIKEFRHCGGHYDLVKQEASAFAQSLNEQGTNYLVYSTSGYPGFTHWTFRGKNEACLHSTKLSTEKKL